MEFLREIYSTMFGGMSLSYLLSALFWMILSISIVKYIKYQRKDKGVPRGGKDFSFYFWLKDNTPDILFHIAVALLITIFPTETTSLFGLKFAAKESNPMWQYVLQGLFFQSIIEALKKKFR